MYKTQIRVFNPRSSAAQTDDGFDVMSLREEIEGEDGVEGVAAGEEFFEIAGEGGGVTGDVGDGRGMKIEDAFDYCRFGAGSWGIKENEISRVCGTTSEPIGDCRRDHAGV